MTHIDDDVVTFMFLSQTDPQVRVIDQAHVLLQHLSSKNIKRPPNRRLAAPSPYIHSVQFCPNPHLCGG